MKKHDDDSHPGIDKSVVTECIEKVLPKVVNKQIEQVLTQSLASQPLQKHNSSSDEFFMVVNGIPDDQTTLYKQIESDSVQLNKVFNHIGVNTEDKLSSVKRLPEDATTPDHYLLNLFLSGLCETCLLKLTY